MNDQTFRTHEKASAQRRWFRPLTNPATAEISLKTSAEVEISACFVNAGCKIGCIRSCMRPLLQPAFPRLAAFLSVWQSADFVSRLNQRHEALAQTAAILCFQTVFYSAAIYLSMMDWTVPSAMSSSSAALKSA